MSYSIGNADTLGDQLPAYYTSGQLPPPLIINAIYAAQGTDNVLLCNVGGLGYTVTLPVILIVPGKVYNIKKVSGLGVLTLAVWGGALIEGNATLVIALNVNVQVVFDG